MLNPLVSVIIPTYKRPDMLVRAVSSVLAQTYNPIEIIIVDDNGRDTELQVCTYNVLSSILKKDEQKIQYFVHEVNKGGSAARNTGWKNSNGKYITFLDDDDEMSIYRIEKQVKCMETLDETWGACYTGYHKLLENGTILKSSENSFGNVYLQTLMRTLYIGSGSNLLLRSVAVKVVDGYDESFRRNQDLEFMVRIAEKYKFAYIPEDLLTIHYEVRQFKYLDCLDDFSLFYLQKFKSRIDQLAVDDKLKVLTVISLERARFMIMNKQYKSAIVLLFKNSVKLSICLRYVLYLINRYVKKRSYGFYY